MLSDIVSKLSSHVVRVDVRIKDQCGNGSGLLIDDKGTILTYGYSDFPDVYFLAKFILKSLVI